MSGTSLVGCRRSFLLSLDRSLFDSTCIWAEAAAVNDRFVNAAKSAKGANCKSVSCTASIRNRNRLPLASAEGTVYIQFAFSIENPQHHQRHIVVLGSASGESLRGGHDSGHRFKSWQPVAFFC